MPLRRMIDKRNTGPCWTQMVLMTSTVIGYSGLSTVSTRTGEGGVLSRKGSLSCGPPVVCVLRKPRLESQDDRLTNVFRRDRSEKKEAKKEGLYIHRKGNKRKKQPTAATLMMMQSTNQGRQDT